MNPINFSAYNTKTKVFLGTSLVLSIAVIAAALYGLSGFTVKQWAILGFLSLCCLIMGALRLKFHSLKANFP